MKRVCILGCFLLSCAAAFGQQSDVTYETSKTTTVPGGADLLTPLWQMEDATPVNTGQVDLRMRFSWVTESDHSNLGDVDDDFVLSPSIAWGAAENLELSLAWDAWLFDSGDMGPFDDGNYDTTIGVLWRLHQQTTEACAAGCLRIPSIAISGKARIPTGCTSSGVDGELRLILTNEYDSGLRSHVNVFGKTVNGTNLETARNDDFFGGDSDAWGLDGSGDLDVRDFQWGLVLGLDGPIGDSVRWVADYMNRSSKFCGNSNMNILELGLEWKINDANKLGTSFQIGLDHMGENPNFGAGIAYSYSLTY
jgi:hypothetical protein